MRDDDDRAKFCHYSYASTCENPDSFDADRRCMRCGNFCCKFCLTANLTLPTVSLGEGKNKTSHLFYPLGIPEAERRPAFHPTCKECLKVAEPEARRSSAGGGNVVVPPSNPAVTVQPSNAGGSAAPKRTAEDIRRLFDKLSKSTCTVDTATYPRVEALLKEADVTEADDLGDLGRHRLQELLQINLTDTSANIIRRWLGELP